MAYLELQSSADYNIHRAFEVETGDHGDHTFSGIMFDVAVKSYQPIDFIEISGVWVRGQLGPMTVWSCQGSSYNKEINPSFWKKVFDEKVSASSRQLKCLQLNEGIRVKSGERVGLYIHSRLAGDSALVYDNERQRSKNEDGVIKIFSGAAHVSSTPFALQGFHGPGWRPNREFVGKLSYGVRYLMWRPEIEVHKRFCPKFRAAAKAMALCSNKKGCVLNWLPVDVTFYILNMCNYDWFGEDDCRENQAVADVEVDEEEEDHGFGWLHERYIESFQLLYLRMQRNHLAMQLANGQTPDPGFAFDIMGNDDDDDDDDEADEDFVLMEDNDDDDDEEEDGHDEDYEEDADGDEVEEGDVDVEGTIE